MMISSSLFCALMISTAVVVLFLMAANHPAPSIIDHFDNDKDPATEDPACLASAEASPL
jgi:hypothetical protein